jgi:vacuolar-type H+-ATPase subunit D/Vma8
VSLRIYGKTTVQRIVGGVCGKSVQFTDNRETKTERGDSSQRIVRVHRKVREVLEGSVSLSMKNERFQRMVRVSGRIVRMVQRSTRVVKIEKRIHQ